MINRIENRSLSDPDQSDSFSHSSKQTKKLESPLEVHYKIGFIGVGNMAQAIIKGLLESKIIGAKSVFCTNRSEGKLQKTSEFFGIQALTSNEDLIDQCDVIVLAMKPQDLSAAIDPVASAFRPGQIVISLAAGVTLRTLEKKLPDCRIVRVMPNTPTLINKGVTGYLTSEKDVGLETLVEDLFTPLGSVFKVEDEMQFEALMVSCSSGTGFVFELMMYFQDWIEERGFEPDIAKKMVIDTFLGAAMMAKQSGETGLEELQNKVTSKKGVTSAGLQSMRELEIERTLRYSFEKAALRNQELAKESESPLF